MSKFVDAMQAGISAADQAEAQAREITQLLAELDRAVRALTQDALSIELKNTAMDLSDPFLLNLAVFFNRKTQTSLVLRSNLSEDAPEAVIAAWRQDGDGYPCCLMCGQSELICLDRKSLEQHLKRLLASPAFGKGVKAVLAQQRLAMQGRVAANPPAHGVQTLPGTRRGQAAVSKKAAAAGAHALQAEHAKSSAMRSKIVKPRTRKEVGSYVVKSRVRAKPTSGA